MSGFKLNTKEIEGDPEQIPQTNTETESRIDNTQDGAAPEANEMSAITEQNIKAETNAQDHLSPSRAKPKNPLRSFCQESDRKQ